MLGLGLRLVLGLGLGLKWCLAVRFQMVHDLYKELHVVDDVSDPLHLPFRSADYQIAATNQYRYLFNFVSSGNLASQCQS